MNRLAGMLLGATVVLSRVGSPDQAWAVPTDDDPAWAAEVDQAGGVVGIEGRDVRRADRTTPADASPRSRVIHEVTYVPQCRVGGAPVIAATASCEPVRCEVSDGRVGELRYRMTRKVDSVTGEEVMPLARGPEVCIANPGAPAADLDSAVLREFRSLRLPGLRVRTDPAGWTLVNLPTRLWVEPSWTERSLGQILGRQVAVQITPVAYHWSFGDGAVHQELGPRQEEPERTVRHIYLKPGVVEPSITTVYRARYRVDGGPARAIHSTVAVQGPATDLDVWEARSELVANPGY